MTVALSVRPDAVQGQQTSFMLDPASTWDLGPARHDDDEADSAGDDHGGRHGVDHGRRFLAAACCRPRDGERSRRRLPGTTRLQVSNAKLSRIEAREP